MFFTCYDATFAKRFSVCIQILSQRRLPKHCLINTDFLLLVKKLKESDLSCPDFPCSSRNTQTWKVRVWNWVGVLTSGSVLCSHASVVGQRGYFNLFVRFVLFVFSSQIPRCERAVQVEFLGPAVSYCVNLLTTALRAFLYAPLTRPAFTEAAKDADVWTDVSTLKRADQKWSRN